MLFQSLRQSNTKGRDNTFNKNNLNKNEIKFNNNHEQTLISNNSTNFDFSKLTIQPKLKLSQPNDPLEREADKVAEQIVRMPVPFDNKNIGIESNKENNNDNNNNNLQIGYRYTKYNALSFNKKHVDANRKSLANSDISFFNIGLSEGGHPLDTPSKEFMESRFGYDFSNVRIHDNEKASKSAKSINALAYTINNNIVFEKGYFDPMSIQGKKLLTHELVHVMQQSNAVNSINFSFNSKDDAGRFFYNPRNYVSNDIVQRRPIEGGGATPGEGQGVDLIFIIEHENDKATQEMIKYVKTVLNRQTYVPVDNLNQIFDYLAENHIRRSGMPDPLFSNVTKLVRRIRIVAHGGSSGSLFMRPENEKELRWVGLDEIQKYI
ncbi:MAG: DUF4157 domain-containing protein [Candidatus Nitrosocosmicus sp.]|nr:DUF4157 domain-containing protein [Candidatus Nitrosocosmicus sp.]